MEITRSLNAVSAHALPAQEFSLKVGFEMTRSSTTLDESAKWRQRRWKAAPCHVEMPPKTKNDSLINIGKRYYMTTIYKHSATAQCSSSNMTCAISCPPIPGQAIIILKKGSLSKIVNNREEENQENHKISCHMAFQGSTIIHRPIQSLIKHSKAHIMVFQGPTILHRRIQSLTTHSKSPNYDISGPHSYP